MSGGTLFNISVKSDLAATVNAFARIAGEQMPFATALALTRTAKAAKQEVERQMPSLIDRPTPYTLKGFRLYPATKARLIAEVTFREAFGRGTAARDYLSPLVYGGPRKVKAFERSLERTGLLPDGMAAVPGSAAKLDQFGNMSRGQIIHILTYLKAMGEQGYRANMTDKRRASLQKGSAKKAVNGLSYFVGAPAGGKLPMGVWQKTHMTLGTAIKPIIIFIKRPAYRPQLDVPGISQRTVNERFAIELQAAVKQARMTAIPKQQLSFA